MTDESMEGLARNEPRCAECIARPFDAKNPHAWKDYPSTEYDDYANAKHEAWDDGARVGFAAGRAALPDPPEAFLCPDCGHIGDAVSRIDRACVNHPPGERRPMVRLRSRADAERLAAALPDPPTDCTCGEFCSGCGGRRAVTPDEGWSPGIDDPKPPALGDIDTGEGWYQT